VLHGGSDERVAEALHGPNVLWPSRVVAERRSDLGHEDGKIDVGDERIRPESSMDVGFRDGFRAPRYQECEKIERLWREMDGRPGEEHLPRTGIEREATEDDGHRCCPG